MGGRRTCDSSWQRLAPADDSFYRGLRAAGWGGGSLRAEFIPRPLAPHERGLQRLDHLLTVGVARSELITARRRRGLRSRHHRPFRASTMQLERSAIATSSRVRQSEAGRKPGPFGIWGRPELVTTSIAKF